MRLRGRLPWWGIVLLVFTPPLAITIPYGLTFMASVPLYGGSATPESWDPRCPNLDDHWRSIESLQQPLETEEWLASAHWLTRRVFAAPGTDGLELIGPDGHHRTPLAFPGGILEPVFLNDGVRCVVMPSLAGNPSITPPSPPAQMVWVVDLQTHVITQQIDLAPTLWSLGAKPSAQILGVTEIPESGIGILLGAGRADWGIRYWWIETDLVTGAITASITLEDSEEAYTQHVEVHPETIHLGYGCTFNNSACLNFDRTTGARLEFDELEHSEGLRDFVLNLPLQRDPPRGLTNSTLAAYGTDSNVTADLSGPGAIYVEEGTWELPTHAKDALKRVSNAFPATQLAALAEQRGWLGRVFLVSDPDPVRPSLTLIRGDLASSMRRQLRHGTSRWNDGLLSTLVLDGEHLLVLQQMREIPLTESPSGLILRFGVLGAGENKVRWIGWTSKIDTSTRYRENEFYASASMLYYIEADGSWLTIPLPKDCHRPERHAWLRAPWGSY